MTTLDGTQTPGLHELLGRQTPTHELQCPYERTLAEPAIGLIADCGIVLDPWQQNTLRWNMGVDAKGLWTAYENVEIVSRRNGKSIRLLARALAGLFLLRETNLLWTAHRYDTVQVSFRLMAALIKNNPDLRGELLPKRNEGISTKNGEESITLRTGAVINFKTRGNDTARGFDGDLLIVDEAQAATAEQMSAIGGTLVNADNPQIYYAASAGGPKSHVLGDLVHRALNTREGDPVRERLYFAAWSAEEDDDPSSPYTWAKTNPAYNLRMKPETMQAKYNELRYRPAYFLQEHCGVGNYPRPESETWIVPALDWEARADEDSTPVGPVVLAAHAHPDQSSASISLAGYRTDGAVHMQMIAHDRGTRWVPSRLVELRAALSTTGPVIVSAKSPLGYLVRDIEALGIEVRLLTPEEQQDAASWFITSATEERPPEPDPDALPDVRATQEDLRARWRPSVRHRNQASLTVALAEASLRMVGERYVISSYAPIDVSPLISAVYAGHGLALIGQDPAPPPSPRLLDSTTSHARGDAGDFNTMNF